MHIKGDGRELLSCREKTYFHTISDWGSTFQHCIQNKSYKGINMPRTNSNWGRCQKRTWNITWNQIAIAASYRYLDKWRNSITGVPQLSRWGWRWTSHRWPAEVLAEELLSLERRDVETLKTEKEDSTEFKHNVPSRFRFFFNEGNILTYFTCTSPNPALESCFPT